MELTYPKYVRYGLRVPTFSRGKPIDDLSPARLIDLLVKILSLSSSVRGFRHFLTPSNLREVFDHPNNFILLKVSRLNFESSRDAQERERVQSHLLTQIQEAFEEMAGSDVGDAYPFLPPPS